MKTAVLAEPVLVGREHELEELQQALDSAIKGRGKTVFIAGEAGSGKTRLAREFLESAKKRGTAIMAGWCLSDATAPYFPFVEAFNTYFVSFEQEEPADLHKPEAPLSLSGAAQRVSEERGVSAWLTGPKAAEKSGRPQVISPQVWKDQVFVGVARTLHEISVQSPIVLFLEDIHWADSASLALLHYIARVVDNSEKILILATFRSEELTADAEGHPHPLAETLRAMRREDLFTEIKLPNLSQANVSEIALNMLGGSLQPSLTEKLATESRGNPLFVVESLRMLHERKSLVQENNEWRLAIDELVIPPKIKDIILRRLAVLKYGQRRVLDAASVIGEKFDVKLLSTVLGLDSLEVLETLNVIAHSTSLVCVEESRYRFDHARSRETLYEELSPPLKRGYHAKIAEKLEDMFKGGKLPFSDLAYHFSQAENKEKATKYALAAGQDALARWSNTEAFKHFTYVLQTIGQDPERAGERENALEGLGDAFCACSLFQKATRTFEELGDTAETSVVKLRAFRKAVESAFQQGDPLRMLELVKKAEPYAAADCLENARVLGCRSRAFMLQSKLSSYIKDLEDALQVFEEEYSLWDVAWALMGVGNFHAGRGKDHQGLAEALRSIALFDELGDLRSQMETCFVAGFDFIRCQLYNEALDVYAKIIAIDENMKMGDYLHACNAYAWSGVLFSLYIGDFEKGLSYNLKALELSRKTDSLVVQGVVYSNLVRAYALLGDVDRAEEYFEKLMKLPQHIFNFNPVGGEFAKAIFLAAKGQWKDFEELFERLKASHDPGWSQAAEWYYAWVLERQGRLEEARAQREKREKGRREAEERFEHANVQANLMVRGRVVVGEEFEMRLDLVSVGRKPSLLVRVESMVPNDFKVVNLPSSCSLQNGSLEMKEKHVGPFQVETIKLKLEATKAGTYSLNPEVVYADDLGKTNVFKANPITVTVQPAKPAYEALPGRITTGYAELDRLLLGGIPENYAVVLASPSIDERALLVNKFLEAGANACETTFYVTVEAGSAKALAEEQPSNFFLLICNIQADAMIQNMPNVFKLKGIESLTEIDIALTKASRILKPSAAGPKRICIDIVSDVLLQHHVVIARKWLSALIPDLKSKGFTILATVDPQMHPAEELQAVLGLFDGEINIHEKETPKGTARFLKIKKMTGQKYLKDETPLTEE